MDPTVDIRTGEQWLDVPGYVGLYKVSSHGRVWGVKRQKFLRPWTRGGYLSVYLCGGKPKIFSVHRLVALAFIQNPLALTDVDHIDGDKLYNHVGNLRWATHQENCRNRRPNKNVTSGFKGVYTTVGNMWQAKIGVDGKDIHLGVFQDPETAAHMYDAAARAMYGRFAWTNFKLEDDD
jgi:hypothetical protein